METPRESQINPISHSDSDSESDSNSPSGIRFPPLHYFHSPLSSLLEYSGLIPTRPDNSQAQFSNNNNNNFSNDHTNNNNFINTNSSNNLINNNNIVSNTNNFSNSDNNNDLSNDNNNGRGEVAIRIIGGAGVVEEGGGEADGIGNLDSANGSNSSNNNNTTSYQRYDIQQVARWIEQILPFSLLLLVVFIRQHLQGFFVIIWVTAFLLKSNDIVRKQTALKGERRIAVLIAYFVAFVLHVVGIYLSFFYEDLYYPLFMVPPKTVPPFWHAIFIILVNDSMARQAAMAVKLVLLMYYKNGKGHNFRRQGQMLTLVEYTLLLYRALLPATVWYRFFMNKEYGGLFSSLTTGLYLTFKLTSIVEKVQSFFASLKALSKKEINYGTYATSEQVNAAGDLCAICQEKMHTPILLRCKHLFCEDCVSEWFERERTCPLCRALVRPADLRSYGDGSTSLHLQIF
ncbi:hypothetical protein LIER_40053 [Lithospermum erythrorhizon]|uniref:RING-type domain-containing protein n=1 Tax=Lithospermum erythrorhizon TaxID=34254 RepID=A0AAV3QSC7_LITER